MGTVYEVEDTSIGKRYVMKILNCDLAHRRDLVAMTRQEARLLAQVKHKNIVDVITAGTTNDAYNLPYIVMEKLDGITLKGLMAARRLPWPFVRQITNELLEALFRMHHPPGNDGQPMIHRDIKPENIFLAKDGEGKYITKLLDLGIASLIDGKKQQGFRGTLKYAAPEQLRGEPLTAQTDLYQAAIVIFEMLTGRHPFADARDDQGFIDAALKRTPPRVTVLVDVPTEVDEAIAVALSKNPSLRPRNAYTFMTSLQGLHDPSRSVPADLVNTTLEDLETAIAKHTESGYEAYATAERSTVDGVAEPPLAIASPTLEDAFPMFAVAATDLARGGRGGTVPMAAPRGVKIVEIDRSGPTHSRREPPPQGPSLSDTEELLEALVVSSQRNRSLARQRAEAEEASRSAPAAVAPARDHDRPNTLPSATAQTATTATTLVREIAHRAIPLASGPPFGRRRAARHGVRRCHRRVPAVWRTRGRGSPRRRAAPHGGGGKATRGSSACADGRGDASGLGCADGRAQCRPLRSRRRWRLRRSFGRCRCVCRCVPRRRRDRSASPRLRRLRRLHPPRRRVL